MNDNRHDTFSITVDNGSMWLTTRCACGWERFFKTPEQGLTEWRAHRVRKEARKSI